MAPSSPKSEGSQSSGGVQLPPSPPQDAEKPTAPIQIPALSPAMSDTSSLSLASSSLGYDTAEYTNWQNERPLWGQSFEFRRRVRDDRPYNPAVDEHKRVIVAGERVYKACFTEDHERRIVSKMKYAPGVRGTQWRLGAGGGRDQYMPLQSETKDQFYESSRSPEGDESQCLGHEQDQNVVWGNEQPRVQDRERLNVGSRAKSREIESWRRSGPEDHGQHGTDDTSNAADRKGSDDSSDGLGFRW